MQMTTPQAQPTTASPPIEPDDEKYLVFSESGDFWLGVWFTSREVAQKQADMKPGQCVRPLSEVLAEQDAAA